MEWLSMDLAPKDGSRFIGLTWDHIVKQGYWCAGWFWADGSTSIQDFTGWMPRSALPPAPTTGDDHAD